MGEVWARIGDREAWQRLGTRAEGSDTEVEGKDEPGASLRFPAFAASEASYGSRGDDDDGSMF